MLITPKCVEDRLGWDIRTLCIDLLNQACFRIVLDRIGLGYAMFEYVRLAHQATQQQPSRAYSDCLWLIYVNSSYREFA
jgi:hypothetical protein